MLYTFKKRSKDFKVNEILPFELSGSGDAFYVQIEKMNLSTGELITHLRKDLKLSRKMIGIAGLKDKIAIATQRVSIYDRALNQAGGEQVFLESLSKVATVIDKGRHHTPLNMSTPISNAFKIVLRSTKNLSQDERKRSQAIVESILHNGYPNAFGVQRFGIEGRNSTQGYQLATGTSREKFSVADTIFKLQAYGSKVFNEYLEKRAPKGVHPIDGEILVWTKEGDMSATYGIYNTSMNTVTECTVRGSTNDKRFSPVGDGDVHTFDSKTMIVTAPVPGFNLPMAHGATDGGKFESQMLERLGFDKSVMQGYQKERVYGLRRPIRVYPTNGSVHFAKDDMVIEFTLPSGSYASIVFDMLLDQLNADDR